MKLLIGIPALDEEQSIQSIIERSLAAREVIIRESPVDEVEITVVSDGSTDKTVEIAKRYEGEIKVIVFEKNRGYGAAIKEAWIQSDAELLSFLDADGTCNPEFFAPLCRELIEKEADVTLGCRINPQSKMPLVRRLGNFVFAALLTMFSATRVKDTASGMRVIKRSSLQKLMPLPDGLHFTPAMSARAILSNDLVIKEIDMPYEEREGESKLNIWKDGVRFLRVIFDSALLYCPSRILDFFALVTGIYAIALMVTPAFFYLQNQSLEEWMIYRFVVSSLSGTVACLLFCAGHLGRKIVDITLSNRPSSEVNNGLFGGFFSSPFFWLVPVSLFLIGGALVFPSFIDLIQTGKTNEHWSRFVAMSTLTLLATILIVTRILVYFLNLVAGRMDFLRNREFYADWFKSLRKDSNAG